MLRSSGIGTYLRALLPRVMTLLPETRFCLLGDAGALATESFTRDARVECRDLPAGVYSPVEQFSIPRVAPAETSIFWSPNVNVPVVHPGRLLVTVHDAFYFDPPKGVRTRLDKRVYLAALTWRLRRSASAVLCVSDFTKGELERVGSWPCPLRVVRSGIEPDWFSKPNGERPWPKPYLVYVGNLKPHKNLSRTLVAFARVAQRLPHDFSLIGAGDTEPLVNSLDPRIRSRVHFLGISRRCGGQAARRACVGARARVAVRGLRSSAARGDGARCPGAGLACGVVTRNLRRRRAVLRSAFGGRDCRWARTTSRRSDHARASRARRPAARAALELGRFRTGNGERDRRIAPKGALTTPRVRRTSRRRWRPR